MGAAALRIFSGNSLSPSDPGSLTKRALVVLGFLETIAAGRIETPTSAPLASIAAVCGKTHTKTRGALRELVNAGMISWDRSAGAFALLPPSHAIVRERVRRGGHAPRATPAAAVAGATPVACMGSASASEEPAYACPTPVACVPLPSSNQEKSLSLESGGGIRGRGAYAREETQTEIEFPEPPPSGPDLAKVASLAMDLGGDVYWGVFVDRMARVGYPADWIREAIVCAAARSKLRPEYIHGILKGYQRDGGPPKVAPQAHQATQQPARKSPTREAPRQSPEARQRTLDYLNSRINRAGGQP